VLGLLFVASGVVAALVLSGVIATVFFAVTVAVLLVPLRDVLVERGLSTWWASLVATLAAFVAVALSPLVAVVVLRIDAVVALIRVAPESITVELFGMTYVQTFEGLLAAASVIVERLARTAVSAAPVFALKLTVFAMVVFALLLNQRAVRRPLVVVVAAYHLVLGDVAAAGLVLVVAWLPDVLIRPRLARQTTGLSGTLYFVGFVGGILTLGVVGIVAGPLAIAVLAEAAALLTEDLNEVGVAEGWA
jgi:predicted PurR-regulated permease PerM